MSYILTKLRIVLTGFLALRLFFFNIRQHVSSFRQVSRSSNESADQQVPRT